MPIKDPEKRKKYHSEYMKNVWYPANRKVHCKRVRKNRLEVLSWFRDLCKDRKCSQCGEDHPACMDFHHIDPSKKTFTLGQAARLSTKNGILEEIEKCVVLCSNCHRKLHWLQKRESNS